MGREENTAASESEVGLGRSAHRASACFPARLTVVWHPASVGLIWKVGDQMQSYLFSFEQI